MTVKNQKDELTDLLGPLAAAVEADIDRWVAQDSTPRELAEAMRYCVLGGGKRLRPALVHLAARAIGDGGGELARRAAVAVELVHCYSLVHDDLPAMDDDDLRRGRPTAHVKFGEAMAILAGDALLTRAMGMLAECDHPSAARLVAELAGAAGSAGMIAGQVADMQLCRLPAGIDGLRYIHMHKTAALIRVAARMGAICGGASADALAAVSEYGEKLGLAFQLVDDLLDVTATAAELGKATGKDAAAGKRTHVSELGLDRARALGDELTDQAIRSLAALTRKTDPLRQLAQLLAGRNR